MYAKPEHPVLRTPNRKPSASGLSRRYPLTRSAATWLLVPSDDPERPGIRDVRSGAEGDSVSGKPFTEF